MWDLLYLFCGTWNRNRYDIIKNTHFLVGMAIKSHQHFRTPGPSLTTGAGTPARPTTRRRRRPCWAGQTPRGRASAPCPPVINSWRRRRRQGAAGPGRSAVVTRRRSSSVVWGIPLLCKLHLIYLYGVCEKNACGVQVKTAVSHEREKMIFRWVKKNKKDW